MIAAVGGSLSLGFGWTARRSRSSALTLAGGGSVERPMAQFVRCPDVSCPDVSCVSAALETNASVKGAQSVEHIQNASLADSGRKAVMNAGSLQPQQALGGHRMAAGSAIDRARRAHL